jgi:hypothetical protein
MGVKYVLGSFVGHFEGKEPLQNLRVEGRLMSKCVVPVLRGYGVDRCGGRF